MDIRFEFVSKTYDEKSVLTDLNWRIQDGETWRLDGPSGVGKTTVLRLLMGLEAPTTGRITGTQGVRFAPVFQENRLISRLNAVQNLQLVCGCSRDESCAPLRELRLTDNDLAQTVETLSGGMQRRVALARALCAPSDVLVLDEPFAGLDADNADNAANCIERHRAGRTLILVSHGTLPAFFGEEYLRLA